MQNMNSDIRNGIPAPGFSNRVNHPEILAMVKKNRKAAGIFGFILVPLPIIGFLIYSMYTKDMETSSALLYGAAVSGVFLIFALFGMIKSRAENSYEAVVIEKKTRRRSRGNDRDDDYYTEFITVARTQDGKKKKIIEHEGSMIIAYDYLNEGDRFMYHPQFNFPYELFDKSRAPYIGCVGCRTQNPVEADRCKKCGLPLLK
ncbi:MAG: hypothetical protein IKI68_00155 [Clostridia bacterium]|nr:hypothetical protein [Clostridia bacterium]